MLYFDLLQRNEYLLYRATHTPDMKQINVVIHKIIIFKRANTNDNHFITFVDDWSCCSARGRRESRSHWRIVFTGFGNFTPSTRLSW